MWRFSISESEAGRSRSARRRARDESEVGRLDDRRLRDDEASLEDVPQLADVARPVVGHQERHRLGRDPLDLAVHLDAEVLEEVVDEQRDVLPPLGEAGEPDRDDVQPVVEVLPEPPLLDGLRRGRGSWPR